MVELSQFALARVEEKTYLRKLFIRPANSLDWPGQVAAKSS